MFRRLVSLAVASALLLALLPADAARAQDDGDDEEIVEPSYYGDTELIETLRGFGLLDEWIAVSPVSPEASVLSVSSASYQALRRAFLISLDTWAAQTEALRRDLARLDVAQAHVDLVRAAAVDVRDSLVRDDRLRGPNSETLATIAAALDSLATFAIPEPPQDLAGDPLNRAEAELRAIRDRAETEVEALSGWERAAAQPGVTAFVGFDTLQTDLRNVELMLERGREQLRPAQQRSERLVASALAQIPDLHAARMLEPTDVDGLSVVTVDAYISAAQGAPCSVDWAMLAGIGKIESHHGRLGGATVSQTGQVSTTILGPLLDGGATARPPRSFDEAEFGGGRGSSRAVVGTVLTRPDLVGSWWTSFLFQHDVEEEAEVEEEGNGFAVVVDSDGGRLDGNDQWDRAVGPMQFLPETWSRWATDGNGDGVADPHNLYDSAAAAARFVCHLKQTRGSSPWTYLLGYNDSRSYVRRVLSTAEGLRASLLPEV